MARARILIVDDDADFSAIIKAGLEKRNYEVAMCSDPADCEQRLREFSPDLLILDLMMGGRMEGVILARRLKAAGGPFQNLPILMLTGVRQQTGFFWLRDPRDPVYLPVEEVIEKPVKPADLAQTVERVLAKKGVAAPAPKRTLLIIDDNPTLRAACMEVLLRIPEYAVAAAQDGLSGLEMVRRYEPDLLLVDLCMPGMDGVEVIKKVHTDSPGMPVIGITGDGLAASAAERRLSRKIQWLLKPFTPIELREAVRLALDGAVFNPGSAA
jgi:CheY-like chemotaxis protein